MHSANEFKNMYKDVSDAVNAALSEISELDIINVEAKEKLSGIYENLLEIKKSFDKDLEFLEENSEWEKFTVAFFGETNAGKSTIIESLRILFNEKERERVIVKNNGNIENIEQEFSHIFDSVMHDSEKLLEIYNQEITKAHQFFTQTKEQVTEKSKEINGLESDLLKLNTELKNDYRETIQALIDEEVKKVTVKTNSSWKMLACISSVIALASLSYLGYLGHFNFLLGQ